MGRHLRIPLPRYGVAIAVLFISIRATLWLGSELNLYTSSYAGWWVVGQIIALILIFLWVVSTDLILFWGEQSPEQIKALWDLPGNFTYNKNGFIFKPRKKAPIQFEWSEINEVTCGKLDKYTIDQIYLTIKSKGEKKLEINEDDEGFWLFLRKASEALPAESLLIDALSSNSINGGTIIYSKSELN